MYTNLQNMYETGNYRYHLSDKLGQGAFGTVYKGYSKYLKQPVAIKEIIKSRMGDSYSSSKITREIDNLKQLNHENIVGLLSFEDKHDKIILVMEYCNAGDLAKFMSDKQTS